MLRRGRTDALFIVRRMKEEHKKKNKKLYLYFMDLEKAFDRVSTRVMRIKEERTTRDLGERGDKSI